jgi:hypothetical protein
MYFFLHFFLKENCTSTTLEDGSSSVIRYFCPVLLEGYGREYSRIETSQHPEGGSIPFPQNYGNYG